MNQKIFQVKNLHFYFRIIFNNNQLYDLSFAEKKNDLLEKQLSLKIANNSSSKFAKDIQNQLFKNQITMNKSLENKNINVLVENLTDDKSQVFGRSEYMTSVIFNGKEDDIGKIVQVKIRASNRTTLFGDLINVTNQRVA